MGGSVITDKSRYRTFNADLTGRIVASIPESLFPLALVLGGGSFGHYMSHKYGIPGPVTENSSQGASIVHDDMGSLSALVSEILRQRGISTFSFSPAELMKEGTPEYSEPLRYLEKGVVPVIYGDVYLAGDRYEIYSGDRIMLDLCKTGIFTRSVFLTDVDGIYDKDPKKFSDAKLLTRIEGKIEFTRREGDVTGGMALKYASMNEIKKYVREVYLMNGNYPKRMAQIGTSGFLGTVMN
ncbi:MAG: isopentenyl phosphate kinase [Thermoplasmataceae archaeon]